MHEHPDIDDDALLERFAANTLPAFPHEEHLHVVFVKSARATPGETLEFMRDRIRAMAAANGNPTAYHDTRTVAWVRLIIAARQGIATFDELLRRHPELIRRDLLSDYYTDDLLNSDAARAQFVAPDRGDAGAIGQPFPA